MLRLRPPFVYTMLLAALLMSAVGCGEIDLPQADTPDVPTQTPSGDSNSGGDDTPSDAGGSSSEGGGTSSEGGGASSDGEQNNSDTGTDETDNDEAVAHAELTADGHLLIDDSFYFSVVEFRAIASANSTTKPTEAADMANDYAEGNLDSGWRIPTEDEASRLRELFKSESDIYGDEPLPQLNRLLMQHNLMIISRTERLLCDEGRKSFNFDIGGKISGASGKSTYRLRLVHDK